MGKVEVKAGIRVKVKVMVMFFGFWFIKLTETCSNVVLPLE